MMGAVSNVLALVISIGALATAIITSLRQMRIMQGGNTLPTILEGFERSRSEDFRTARIYIAERLLLENNPEVGVSGLPLPARDYVQLIGGFFDDLGKLVAQGVIDEEVIIGAYAPVIEETWQRISYFAYGSRGACNSDTYVYFENLAALVRKRPPGEVYKKLGLLKESPRWTLPSRPE
jgi:hypothetical protein